MKTRTLRERVELLADIATETRTLLSMLRDRIGELETGLGAVFNDLTPYGPDPFADTGRAHAEPEVEPLPAGEPFPPPDIGGESGCNLRELFDAFLTPQVLNHE